MINPKRMTDDQLVSWIKKTSITLYSHSYSTMGRSDKWRFKAWDLSERFRSLFEEMEQRRIWDKYCEERGLSRDHNAGDCMA